MTIGLGPRSPRNRFSNKPFADDLLVVLSDAGVQTALLAQLKTLSANFGIPFEDGDGRLWLASTDLSYLTLAFQGTKPPRLRVGVLLTDKSAENIGDAEAPGLRADGPQTVGSVGVKPRQAFQWHITDVCDQRCRHCYLFAEDVLARCVITPWDMLMRTFARSGDVLTASS